MLQSSSFFLLVAVSWFPGGCPSPPSPHTFRSVACFFYFSWAFFKGVSDVFFHHHSSCSSSYSCRALFLILMCVLQVTTWFQPVGAISLVICPVWHGHIFRLNIFSTPHIIVQSLIKGCGNVSLQSQKAGPEMKLDSFQCAVKSYSACAPNSTFKFTFYPRHFCKGKGLWNLIRGLQRVMAMQLQ